MTECCQEMTYHLKEEEIHLHYNPICRRYSIDYQKQYGGGVSIINCCPWCGSKLPSDLTDILYQIVHDQFGFETWDDPNLPEEFKSDEWWRKRNL